ncbi:hypothetical protein [Manganibacter manganicus]|uniref:Uncharacterized protein n=1 Tax=Manganibacter manganicus TaxID=1873176 RepID=A0A1V8RNY8_9HYPH|nr:hypothetical protein [Pseudaminobacter manganicus]OQM74922.1 hypothetical protein BFN67_04725 [Pseudaminobacter manganicus]
MAKISLRDRIAIEAMSAIIVKYRPKFFDKTPDENDPDNWYVRVADSAYLYADAMIKARGGE